MACPNCRHQAEPLPVRIPGLALGVVQGEHVAYLKGYGFARPGGRPVTPQTPFILGSTSKSFTALAVMQLVDAGQIDLTRGSPRTCRSAKRKANGNRNSHTRMS